jgi:hypothetical protein
MAKKNKVVKASSFPVQVWLKSPNPYGSKVKVCGIEVSYSKVIIKDSVTLAKLRPIQSYLEVESLNKEPAEVVATETNIKETVNEEELLTKEN